MNVRRRWQARIDLLCFLGALLTAAAARAQIGNIDFGAWSGGRYTVYGWACDRGSAQPVLVTLVDTKSGAALASATANDPSEPAVGAACGVPWATNFRFHVSIDAPAEEARVGQPIAVRALSNVRRDYWGTRLSAWLSNAAALVYPDNTVRGAIDGVYAAGDQAVVVGWACSRGIAQSIWVHVYAGGPAGTGQFMTATFANQASEPAVAAACGVGAGVYRYTIAFPFGPELMMTLGGAKVYVHGISAVGALNLLIGGSGNWPLPGQKATLSGGCGYVPAVWNAPYGAIVLSRSNGGPIKPVIDAIGEHYTHSMLSLGTAGIIHAEMRTPAQSGWPTVCTRPLDAGQLQYGNPGAEQINLAGAWADLQGEEITPAYQWGDPAAAAAIASWTTSAPQTVTQSQSDGSVVIARKLRDGAPINYSLYQYRNIEQTNQPVSASANNGIVCSTFLSWAHVQAGAGVVPAYTYGQPLIANAASSLFNTVQNACSSGVGFWSALLRSVSCPFYNVCENAGDQVTNCMSANQCATDDNAIWHAVRDDPAATATSISADRLAGLPPHGAGTTVWSYDQAYHPIVWNGPGAQYGCWY